MTGADNQTLRQQRRLSLMTKENIMNTNKAININDFCASGIYIPTFDDSGSETWFILTKKAIDALELPTDVEIAELLTEAAYRSEMPAYAKDKSQAWHFVTERGLYALIFMSEAPAFQRFRDWVLEVVLPTVAVDGLYMLKEDSLWMPPSIHDVEGGFELGDLFWLWEDVLPDIRATGGYLAITHVPAMKSILTSKDPLTELATFLQDLKGHRSRKPKRLH